MAMPPHNAFAHVVEEDLPVLDRLVVTSAVRIEPWWPNASIFQKPIDFELQRIERHRQGPGSGKL